MGEWQWFQCHTLGQICPNSPVSTSPAPLIRPLYAYSPPVRRHRTGAPSPTTVTPFRFRIDARIAACTSMACLRVAVGALSAIKASVICRAVIGTPARRITSTALRNSVPRLNQGLPTTRRLGAIRAMLKSGLHHGCSDFDGGALVLKQLPGEFGVKQPQGISRLFRCYFGSGHFGLR
jgi:hypothetical protein